VLRERVWGYSREASKVTVFLQHRDAEEVLRVLERLVQNIVERLPPNKLLVERAGGSNESCDIDDWLEKAVDGASGILFRSTELVVKMRAN
jgi:hypothetical protein